MSRLKVKGNVPLRPPQKFERSTPFARFQERHKTCFLRKESLWRATAQAWNKRGEADETDGLADADVPRPGSLAWGVRVGRSAPWGRKTVGPISS